VSATVRELGVLSSTVKREFMMGLRAFCSHNSVVIGYRAQARQPAAYAPVLVRGCWRVASIDQREGIASRRGRTTELATDGHGHASCGSARAQRL
jgi:hypothetical protein